MIVAALEEAGHQVDDVGCRDGRLPRRRAGRRARCLVAQEDLARAQEMIRKGEDDEEDVDWSQVDVGAAGRMSDGVQR